MVCEIETQHTSFILVRYSLIENPPRTKNSSITCLLAYYYIAILLYLSVIWV